MKNFAKYTALVVTTLVALTFLSTPAFADYLPEEKSAAEAIDGFDLIVDFLRAEQFVPSRIEFKSMSADPVKDLNKIAKSGKYTKAMRARAIQSLALYTNDTRAVESIDAFMKKVRPGNRLFPAVLIAYAQIHGEGAAATVVRYTSNHRRDVRVAAVIALGRFGGQEGYETLKTLAVSEKSDVVLSRIHMYVD